MTLATQEIADKMASDINKASGLPATIEITGADGTRVKSNGNGAGTVPAAVVQAAALEADAELAKKMAAVQSLGKQILATERKRAKQETVCAEKKSELDTEREALHKIEHSLEELHDELATLAAGKNSERLPFGEVRESGAKDSGNIPSTDAKSVATPDDAWRSVQLSTLTPAIKPAKLKALAENATPITTLGELSDWQTKKGEFWAKEIRGLGDGGREQVEKACEAYYAANPIPPHPSSLPSGDAPFDDAAIKMETAESIIKHPVCYVDVAQRAGGKWAARWKITLGKQQVVSVTAKQSGVDEWEGMYASRFEAIATGMDAVYDLIRSTRGTLSGKPKKYAAEITAQINEWDKKLAETVKAEGVADDVKAFWEARPAREAEEAKAAKKKGGKS